MQIDPYLIFNGNCEAAFKFYEQCFRGKIQGIAARSRE
jgi:PhnB protein